MVASILHMNLQHIVKTMESRDNLQQHTHLNKTGILREKSYYSEYGAKLVEEEWHVESFLAGRSKLVHSYFEQNSYVLVQHMTPEEAWSG